MAQNGGLLCLLHVSHFTENSEMKEICQNASQKLEGREIKKLLATLGKLPGGHSNGCSLPNLVPSTAENSNPNKQENIKDPVFPE